MPHRKIRKKTTGQLSARRRSEKPSSQRLSASNRHGRGGLVARRQGQLNVPANALVPGPKNHAANARLLAQAFADVASGCGIASPDDDTRLSVTLLSVDSAKDKA